jgi:hypothetical protein
MGIIRQKYQLLDDDDPNSSRDKINKEFRNIIDNVNDVLADYEPGNQGQGYIIKTPTTTLSGNVNLYETAFTFNQSSFTLLNTSGIKILFLFVQIEVAFTRGAKLEIKSGTKVLLKPDQIFMHVAKSNYVGEPTDLSAPLIATISGSPSAGSGKIIMVTG